MSTKIDQLRARIGNQLAQRRQTMRMGVHAAEVLLGSFASGYMAERVGTVAGVPADAGGALILLTAGVMMKQGDAMALGLGMAAGYTRDMGRAAARDGIGSVLPFEVVG